MCDSTVHAHTGRVVSRGYRQRLHLVAEALVAVDRGVRRNRAAQRARVLQEATRSRRQRREDSGPSGWKAATPGQ